MDLDRFNKPQKLSNISSPITTGSKPALDARKADFWGC